MNDARYAAAVATGRNTISLSMVEAYCSTSEVSEPGFDFIVR